MQEKNASCRILHLLFFAAYTLFAATAATINNRTVVVVEVEVRAAVVGVQRERSWVRREGDLGHASQRVVNGTQSRLRHACLVACGS